MSLRPSATPEPRTFRVLIVEPDGRSLERTWPAEVVLPLGVPADALALPPLELPETAAATTKDRFDLHTLVRGSSETEWRVVPTTSPQALGLAVLALLVAVFVRNMVVAGSPLAIEPRGVWLPPALARPGAPAPPVGTSRSRPGPPAPRPRTGRGRR